MTRFILLTLTLLVLSSSPAYAEWVLVHTGEDGMTVYVNPATSRRNGDVMELWVLVDYKTIQTAPPPPYLSEKSQREIDCTQERIRLLAVTTFSAIWEAVNCSIAILTPKIRESQLNQAVLLRLCGNLPATRSNRAVNSAR